MIKFYLQPMVFQDQLYPKNSPFTSAKMKEFLTTNEVKQITLSSYHPSSNGLAERAVLMGRQFRTSLDLACPITSKMLKPSRNIIMTNMQKTEVFLKMTEY